MKYTKKTQERKRMKTRKQKRRIRLKKHKTRQFRRGGNIIADGSYKIGKSATITVRPSNLYKSKFVSNISVTNNSGNDIDETLSSMVKSISRQHPYNHCRQSHQFQ